MGSTDLLNSDLRPGLYRRTANDTANDTPHDTAKDSRHLVSCATA